ILRISHSDFTPRQPIGPILYKHAAIFQSRAFGRCDNLPPTSMGNRTRKSTALVSLVLVPLNLLGLGFAGCDSRDDNADFATSAPASNDAGDASPGDF